MNAYQINLIRDRVVAPKLRKSLYLSMCAYQIIGVLLLALVINNAISKTLETRDLQSKLTLLETKVATRCGVTENHQSEMDIARDELALYTVKLNMISKALRDRIDLTSVLLGITQQLPYGVSILNLDYAEDTKKLTFELRINHELARTAPTTSELLKLLNENPLLSQAVGTIQPMTEETLANEKQSVAVVKFFCSLEGKET